MAVYDRAVDKVEKKERYAVFNIYLKKAAEIYGVTKTRAIYEKVNSISFSSVREIRVLVYLLVLGKLKCDQKCWHGPNYYFSSK